MRLHERSLCNENKEGRGVNNYPLDDCFDRFRSLWNDAYLSSWTHLAFRLSYVIGKQQRQQR